ncbi:3-hydroxy-acyl-CoA-dehydrogenase [Sistotremastrum suecicum HHB10207 ss-3]|uniref:3-hydroxy-acyl-CoA-dehydrogenase n=1 Tax=Sistotremastrum suecicum HHB10207 ss-3 TaxID=1314776 RepID=A0A166CYI8_9AGAM|nr:3-hydroxy-acyl-CoA-dehydrogenase [Sistotremastrum suecicum HHB10207 ss-3]
MKISNRTFIVSGGSAGLGLATVEALHDAGAYITVFDMKSSKDDFAGLSRVKFLKVDITKVDEIQDAVDKTAQWSQDIKAPFGGVVHCAGIGAGGVLVQKDGTPHSLETWNKVIDVNLTGTFNLSRLACQRLISVPPEGPDGERGVIIMVSSADAYEGQPSHTAYVASKGAIRSMTLPMARDLGRYGIRVNSIAPSAFKSAMTDQMPAWVRNSMEKEYIFPKRMGVPVEFAQTVKWILECPYANGDTFRLSGATRIPVKL